MLLNRGGGDPRCMDGRTERIKNALINPTLLKCKATTGSSIELFNLFQFLEGFAVLENCFVMDSEPLRQNQTAKIGGGH